jgi:DNA-binding MarR family transcriptional regulator
MLDKNSDISRVVDRMLNKKLVIRKECKQDRRQKDIQISQLGLDYLSKIDDQEKELDQKMQHLTLDEVFQLNNLLDKIRD